MAEPLNHFDRSNNASQMQSRGGCQRRRGKRSGAAEEKLLAAYARICIEPLVSVVVLMLPSWIMQGAADAVKL
ncbi:uncharacterized protein MYCFIDRAFT_169470 [Pseudocercospora fijiensis CIRAD86]|uniref:Uncharacterized protein n=1 Tax=Pseudocercospora fijiensis (strain CIRAD86) TaxID=383855 RepID=N1Q672_PSEFD|nr:uncharacterized protein MYCFIDRAFT_169470 [Pseudocercospora fijiensis CIRAD86]EME87694.1 hypothetical protein MYCFIDRAFT_169470 [Pseudocercospora fijiensis CIRAD86]